MEGYWFEGKWMSPQLYFYVNLCKIEISTSKYSANKVLGSPFLRDLEWEKSYVLTEARGFSGFEGDEDITCLWEVDEINKMSDVDRRLYLATNTLPPEVYKKDGSFKMFVNPRLYLRRIHPENYGKALYYNQAKNVIDIEARGGGKDLIHSTLLHYADGTHKPISKVEIGDVIFGGDGKPTTVVDRTDFNDQMQYRVDFADGRSVTCGGGHLWAVYKNRKLMTLSLDDIKESYFTVRSTGVKDFKYAVPMNGVIMYAGEDPDIDPYYFGLWLGDGNSHNTGVTTMDSEIVDYLETVRIKEGMSTLNINTKPNNKASTYTITNGGKGGIGYSNPLKNKLRKLGVLKNKHIPKDVLHSSFEYRLAVLQGLMDSDGFCDGSHNELSTSYEGIQNTILLLLRGLGIKYNARVKKTKCKDTLRISLFTTLPLFRLSRKLDVKFEPSFHSLCRYEKTNIVDITPLRVEPSVCIGVDNDDHLFLVDDFVVTHNSYWGAGGMITHNFLFDGYTDYDVYLEAVRSSNDGQVTNTIVGAIEETYIADLLNKVEVMFNNLKGSQLFNGISHPSPLQKGFSGSFWSGKKRIKAEIEKNENGNKVMVGSGSAVYNKSFNNNHKAGNGKRTNLSVLEEVGFFSNLIESLGSMKDVTYSGISKFGTIYMFGTGGDMQGGSSEQARIVFNDPDQYDCLCFQDTWEETGYIGYFVPYQMTLNELKDDEGNTKWDIANKFVKDKRDKLSKGNSKKPLEAEMQNNPEVPSEAFLIKGSNIFPTADIAEQIRYVQSHQHNPLIKGQCGELAWANEKDKINIIWKPDLEGKLTPTHYGMKKEDDATGCIQIWEHPIEFGGQIPYGLYVAGTDPYDQDQSVSTKPSLGSTFIYKSYCSKEGVYEWPVAEYTARPATAKEHHENIRKLLLYYNAKDLYENERNSLKMHFEQKHSLYLLAKTPDILKSLINSNVDRHYGTHMTAQIKKELEIYTRDWLTEDAGDGKLNLHKVFSLGLLHELMYYNDEGNFDRVIAFMLTICHRNMNYHLKVKELKKQEPKDNFLQRGFKKEFIS